jgi:hypothetical protein
MSSARSAVRIGWMRRATVSVVLSASLAMLGFAGCGGDSGGEVRTVTVTVADAPAQETPTPAPVDGDAILIRTRVTNARRHISEVLDGSVIGESAFCRGGKISGGSNGPTITSTFHCPAGTLTLEYAPTQRSLVQGNVWGIAGGTGRFKGLRGGGSMVAEFESDDPDRGREFFTGTVGR